MRRRCGRARRGSRAVRARLRTGPGAPARNAISVALDRRVGREVTFADGERMVAGPEGDASLRRHRDEPAVLAGIAQRPRRDDHGRRHTERERQRPVPPPDQPERGEREKEQHARTHQDRRCRPAARPRSSSGRRRAPSAASAASALAGMEQQDAAERERHEQRLAEHVGRDPDQRRIDGGDAGGDDRRPLAPRRAPRDDADQPDRQRAEQRLRHLDPRRGACAARRRRRSRRGRPDTRARARTAARCPCRGPADSEDRGPRRGLRRARDTRARRA